MLLFSLAYVRSRWQIQFVIVIGSNTTLEISHLKNCDAFQGLQVNTDCDFCLYRVWKKT